MVKKPRLWTYTITIAEQDREIVILPDITSTWKLRSGDTIKFINNTKYEVTVKVSPDGWLDGQPIVIKGSSEQSRGVSGMPDPGTTLRFTFSISANGGVFMVSGGPKMAPTEPSES